MPIAGLEITEKLTLPTKGAYVILLTNPKSTIMQAMGEDANEKDSLVKYLIREWNFTDETGTPLPITQENTEKALSIQDNMAINEFLGFDKLMLSSSKKNS